MTTDVLMKRSNWLLLVVICFTFCVGSCLKVVSQDSIPSGSPWDMRMKKIKSVREISQVADTISVQVIFPQVFREMGKNEIVDSIRLLPPFFERLRQVRAGLSEDTVQIVHLGDSHVRGQIYPRTVGTRLTETFGAITYTDFGVNGATCLTFTSPDRMAEITALQPDLLILSLGTNESHNRQYDANAHYNQMEDFISLLRDSMPVVPIILTTPPGSYDSSRQRRRKKRTYSINPRTATAAGTIRRFADDHHLLVWDMYDVVGGSRRACKNWTEAGLMRPDYVHYLPEGYVLQGNLLYEALIKAYNDYVAH